MTIAEKITDYFRGSIAEMKKVVWPTRTQTIKYSAIVIALSVGMAIFFGLLDYIFNIGLEFILR